LDHDPRISFAVLDTQTLAVNFFRANYDLEPATRAILESGMPEEIAWLVRSGARRIEEVQKP
jgi:hypothetical protein